MDADVTGRWRRDGSMLRGAMALVCALALPAAAGAPEQRVVERVDLARYAGKWYEIASFPQWFQRGCAATTATYTLRQDGKVGVLNECRQDEPAGKPRSAEGWARVVDPATNAKLEVTFFWPFFGDYWIIDLGQDYEYAVVGHPNREYLWILSRSPQLPAATLEAILTRARDQGYDLSKLRYTRHF